MSNTFKTRAVRMNGRTVYVPVLPESMVERNWLAVHDDGRSRSLVGMTLESARTCARGVFRDYAPGERFTLIPLS